MLGIRALSVCLAAPWRSRDVRLNLDQRPNDTIDGTCLHVTTGAKD